MIYSADFTGPRIHAVLYGVNSLCSDLCSDFKLVGRRVSSPV